MNLSSLIKRIANKYPEKTAIIEEAAHSPSFNEGEKGGFSKQISYSQLWQKIESLSKAFKAIGIRKNNRVAIILPNCKEFIFSFFALLNINAIAVPLKQMTCWELAGIFKNCKPKVIILTPNLLNKILTSVHPKSIQNCHFEPRVQAQDKLREKSYCSLLNNRILIIKEGKDDVRILDKHGDLEDAAMYTMNDLYEIAKKVEVRKRAIHTHPGQIASINYTYRGYGYPLGAMLTHNNYIHGAKRYSKFAKPQAIVLLLLPSSHIFPLTTCIIIPLLEKSTIVISIAISPKKIFQTIEKNKVDRLICVPTLFEFLQKHYDNTKWDLSSLKFGISGAEYMSVELHDLIKGKMGIDIIQGYGLTETLPITCNPRQCNRSETIGIPENDVKIKIVNEKGIECRTGEVGEIIVKCPSVMAGYYKAHKETADVIKGDWFYTGDHGRIDHKGYVYFNGLKKQIAKVDGITVDLNEIKKVFNLHSKIHVRDVFTEEIIEKRRQKRSKGIIVRYSIDGNFNPSPKEIIKFLSRYLSQYKLPKKLIKVS